MSSGSPFLQKPETKNELRWQSIYPAGISPRGETIMIRLIVFGLLLAAFIGQFVNSKAANALSCRNRQEIKSLISTVAGGRNGAENIVEVMVEDVTITRQRLDRVEAHIKRLTEMKAKAGNKDQEISLAREIRSLGFVLRDLQREATITFTVKTLEVFKGEAISRFVLENARGNIAGVPDIGRCDGGQDMHVNLDRIYHEETKPPKGLYKSGDKSNPLSGYPWHSCPHYKSLKGQRVILLGKGSEVVCTDGIIEIEALTNPDLLREFMRCAGPAARRASELEFGDSVKKGLPGKVCVNKKGSINSTKLWGGKCSPGERRLSWLEERLGQFISPVRLSVMMSCPNPLSIQ
jgi:hypothetical protein